LYRYQSEFTNHVQDRAAAWPSSKKKTVHAAERDTPRVDQARREYRQQVAQYAFARLKFVDESGLNIAMTRRYGRAPRGKRVDDAVPKTFGRNVTILGALSCHGLEAVMTVDGATDAAVFHAYVTHVLAPTLRPDDIVVMNNLSAHKVQGIETTIQATGARLIFLPPYSSDFSPIEECWSKIKAGLRPIKARTRGAFDQALKHLIDTVAVNDTHGWFAHCGYPLR
jgi:transposase